MRQSAPLVYPPEAEIRHGLHYIPRSKEPSMFEILSWKENYDAAADGQWLVRLKEGNREGRFTEQKKYERVEHAVQRNKTSGNNLEVEHHLHPHEIKHELYYYGDEEVKAKKKQTAKQPAKPKQAFKKETKRLDEFKEEERREIEIRKQNIQKFDAFTRELPNSAFTTYFGKPAFAHYGFGSAAKSHSMASLKSHSVMPHAGKNDPEFVQTHERALSKANVINLQSHVPRSPIGSPPPNDCKVAVKEYYNVEIVKPDLVNELRFSNQDNGIKFRSKTPRHDELNYLPKRNYAKSPPIQPIKRPKQKKKARQSEDKVQDKLAFMNKRENFMKEVRERQKIQGRLAYKVTECYPYDWQHETEAASTAREEKWKQIRPAGISSSRSLNATNFRSL